jgi:hypothetical protein
MSYRVTQAELDQAAAAQVDATLFHWDILQELLVAGSGITKLLQQDISNRATTMIRAAGPDVLPHKTLLDLTIPYERLSRAIRRNIMLAEDIAKPIKETAAARTEQRQNAARKQIIRAVEDTIALKAPDDAATALKREFRERLDGPDIDDDIEDRPVPAIIADIIKDLGLACPPGNHPALRRTRQDIAELCARAAKQRPAIPHPFDPNPDGAQPAAKPFNPLSWPNPPPSKHPPPRPA